MIIGFDAKRAFNNRSGLGNYSRDTIRILCKYFPQNQYNLYTPEKNDSINFVPPLNSEVKIPDSFTGKLFKSYWRSVAIKKQLFVDNVVIYHGLSNELPYKINETKIKTVVTIHDLIFMRYPELYKSIDRKIYEKKFRYSCQVADKIIAISNQTKKDIIDFFGTDENKIKIVYQTCNALFKESANDTKKSEIRKKYNLPSEYILYVGTIEKRKNLLSIVKAMNEGNIDFSLVVIGKPTPYQIEINQYISTNNLNNRILFFHKVPLEDLPVFYQMSSLFIYPSIFEGFGIPIIEALYSGTPVITSKGGCFSEAGGADSIYIDPNNSEEISSAIKTVLTDSKLKETIINKGILYAQNFNDPLVVGNLMDVYTKL